MIRFRVLFAAIVAVFACAAVAQDAKFVSALPSPLVQSGTIPPNETVFSGKARISGKFEVILEAGTEGYPGYYRVVIRPDKSSRDLLPHDSERGPVREIWLRNTDAVLRALLSPTQRKALASGKSRSVSGQITVVVASYHSGVDCDQRGYNAKLVSVVRQPSDVVASATPREPGVGC